MPSIGRPYGLPVGRRPHPDEAAADPAAAQLGGHERPRRDRIDADERLIVDASARERRGEVGVRLDQLLAGLVLLSDDRGLLALDRPEAQQAVIAERDRGLAARFAHAIDQHDRRRALDFIARPVRTARSPSPARRARCEMISVRSLSGCSRRKVAIAAAISSADRGSSGWSRLTSSMHGSNQSPVQMSRNSAWVVPLGCGMHSGRPMRE